MALQGIKMPTGEPTVAAGPPVHVAVGNVVLDSGVVIDPRPSGDDVEGAVLDEHEDDDGLSGDVFTDEEDDFTDYSSEEDFSDEEDDFTDYSSEDYFSDDEDVDSDSEFEEDGQPPDARHGTTYASGVISGFLERPTLAASVRNTIGFMRVAAAEAAAPGNDGGEILVHYQYTRFTRAQSGGDGVDTHVLGPKLATVRFHVPTHAVAVDPTSSLRLAGASLASLIYPARLAVQLRALWSALVAVAPLRVSPRATRLVVTVDVGILRHGDVTPERMRSVCAELESVACERDAGQTAAIDVTMELHLPAPLVSEDDVRPTKRRVTGEDCPICCEALEQGLAAWPRCSHIFHGRCLEEHLVRGYEVCPLCRTELKVHASSRESTLYM